MKLCLCIIAKGEDSEVDALYKCLQYSVQGVDQLFLTITHKKGQKPSARMEKLASRFKFKDGAPVISHYEWTYDFAAARNFNFAQVPKEYTHILWLDADDALRGIEKLRATIEAHPNVDAFIFNYLYAFDEHKNPIVVHLKTQVVKNDGCVVWKGQRHEDFAPTRELSTFFVRGIERLHLSNGDRFDAAKVRNLEVAEKNVENLPNDPRSWWNLGQSLSSLQRYEQALRAYETFLESSQSDEEKYIVRLRRAEALWGLGKKPKAIEECQFAIGLRPQYPDAYNLLGNLYLDTKQYEKAAEMYLASLVKKPPVTQILVYNPRDYDYTPLKNLAKAFYALSRPDQALTCLEQCLKIIPKDEDTKNLIKIIKKETIIFDAVVKEVARISKIKDREKMRAALDSLPIELRSHPAVCNLRNVQFIKETSSGKDLIFYCAPTDEVWNPDTAKKKGIGGSEEAVIWLSSLLQKRGWNVTVYASCGADEQVYDGVTWKPYWMWNYRDKQDVAVIWRHPQLTKYEINADKLIVDLHDVIPEGEFTPDRLNRIYKIFVKSKFHRSLYPNIPDEQIAIMPNGIDPTIFKNRCCTKCDPEFRGFYDKDDKCINRDCSCHTYAAISKRDPRLLINTSSADRSLEAFLDCFAEIKKQVPDAKAKWAYGWGVWDATHASDLKKMQWKAAMQARMKDLGVEELGRLSHGEIAKLYLTANIFGYPSEFAEIDCISLSKAMAAGAIPITTDFAAMGEKKHGGVFIHSAKTKDDWAQP